MSFPRVGGKKMTPIYLNFNPIQPGGLIQLIQPGGGRICPPLYLLYLMSPELENRQEQSWGPHLTSSIIKIHYSPLSSPLGVLLQKWSRKFIHRHRLLYFDIWLLYVLHYYIFYFYFNQNLKSCAWNPIENSLKCLSDIEEKSQEIWDLVDQSFFSYKAKTEGGAYLPPTPRAG